MRVIFCCNGNESSGLGHFMRCFEAALSLKAFYPETEISFYGNYLELATRNLLENQITFTNLITDTTFSTDNIASDFDPDNDFIIIDSYIPTQDFYDGLDKAGFKWGAFDDFNTLNFSSAAIVVNFRVNADKLYCYHAKKEALGPAYMPIKREFVSLRKVLENKPVKSSIKNVLVCLGGNDINQASAGCAKALAQALPDATITLICSSPLTESLPASIKIMGLQDNIVDYMKNIDLVISGGGRLKYEACYCGIPNASLAQTNEQRGDTLILEQEGLCQDLGLARELSSVTLREKILQLDEEARAGMKQKQLETFSRDSNKNLANVLWELLAAN